MSFHTGLIHQALKRKESLGLVLALKQKAGLRLQRCRFSAREEER